MGGESPGQRRAENTFPPCSRAAVPGNAANPLDCATGDRYERNTRRRTRRRRAASLKNRGIETERERYERQPRKRPRPKDAVAKARSRVAGRPSGAPPKELRRGAYQTLGRRVGQANPTADFLLKFKASPAGCGIPATSTRHLAVDHPRDVLRARWASRIVGGRSNLAKIAPYSPWQAQGQCSQKPDAHSILLGVAELRGTLAGPTKPGRSVALSAHEFLPTPALLGRGR